jgi:hypothetical protein
MKKTADLPTSPEEKDVLITSLREELVLQEIF